MRAIGYTRVSTDEQGRSGLGLADQRNLIEAECSRRSWSAPTVIVDDGYSAKSLRRPGIAAALEQLAAGDAQVLVAAKLDRLSRSVLDFAALMDRSRREGWEVIVLDLGVDTSTPAGEMMASVVAAFAQYERRLIGQRTAAALAVLKGRGVRLGRPRQLPPDVVARIIEQRHQGATLQAIADDLTADGVPTSQGGARWWPSTVRAVLESVRLDREAAAIAT